MEYLPVAQLDSASDSDSEGRRFESFRVGQKFDKFRLVEFFYPSRRLGISLTHEVRRISSRSARRPCISSRVSVYTPTA